MHVPKANCHRFARGSILFTTAVMGGSWLAGCVPPLTDMGDDADDAVVDDSLVDDGFVEDDTLLSPASFFAFEEDDDPEIAVLPFVEDELLARILPGAKAEELDASYVEIGVTVVEELPELDTVALRVSRDRFEDAAAALSANALFESVHKSYLYDAEALPDDVDFDRQDHFVPIGVDLAWEVTTGSEDMIIAILDTGVEPDHPDLEGKLLDGWNSYDKNDDFDDVLGHGTSVAGSAAAMTNNDDGVAGVCWDNPILPVRVSDDKGRAASKDIASGIVWAIRRGAKVINVSFAPLGSDRTVLAATQYARNNGALVFISTGNNGKSYRARKTDQAIFVGAVDDPDKLAAFSNTGNFVDLVAPGVGIYTTRRGKIYGPVSGTSFASPITAGVAALVWSVNPDFRPATVQNLLLDTADDLGARGRDKKYGVGRVNAEAAVLAALDIVEEPDTKSPSVDILDPDDRDKVSRTINISVAAFDADELADVVLMVDGAAFATDTSKPFKFALNTRDLTNGTHTLIAQATDLSGNSQRSSRVRIVVSGSRSSGGNSGSGGSNSSGPSSTTEPASADTVPPSASFVFPADGTRVFTSVGVQGTVSDDVELESVEWLVDGVRQSVMDVSGKAATVNLLWDASATPSGNHVVTLRVFDLAGNEVSSSLSLLKE